VWKSGQPASSATVTFVIGRALFVAVGTPDAAVAWRARRRQPITLAFFSDQDCRSRAGLRVRGLLYAAGEGGSVYEESSLPSTRQGLGRIGTLVALDPRVGHRLSQFVAGSSGGEFRGATDQAHALGTALLDALKDQSIDHAPLLVFTAIAVLLVGFMVRT
jgi:hypothetical protein